MIPILGEVDAVETIYGVVAIIKFDDMAFPSVIEVELVAPIVIAVAVVVSFAGQFTRVEIFVDAVFIEHTPVLPIFTPVDDTVPKFKTPESDSYRVANTLPLH